MENRSFDHYFGTMSGVAGYSDPRAITLSTGRSVFYQPDPSNADGYLLPFHLDSHKTSAQWITSAGSTGLWRTRSRSATGITARSSAPRRRTG